MEPKQPVEIMSKSVKNEKKLKSVNEKVKKGKAGSKRELASK